MADQVTIAPEAAQIFEGLARAGCSQRELADALGIEQNKISKVKAGERRFTAGEVLKAQRWLMDKLAPETAPPARPSIRPANEGTVQLKVVDLNLAMGDGGNLDDYPDADEQVEFDLGLLAQLTRAPTDRVIVARPKGDSMFPTLINGDWVIIDTTQRVLNLDDKVWACSVYGAGAVKRLKAIGKGRVEVRSDNPVAGNREVDGDDLTILGRVIWVGREM